MNTDRVAEEIGKMVRAVPFGEHVSVARIHEETLIGSGAIAARLDAIEKGKASIEGVAAARVNGVLGAWNTGPEFVRKSLNDPTVECCGRDAADCDCHPLAVMYAKVKERHGGNGADVEDMAREVAIAVISTAGYGTEDTDIMGEPIGGFVQSLLMAAIMRVPAIGNLLAENFTNPYFPLSGAQAEDLRKASTPVAAEQTRRKVDFTNAGLITGKTYRVKYQTTYLEAPSEIIAKFERHIEHNKTLLFRGQAHNEYYIPRDWVLDITDTL